MLTFQRGGRRARKNSPKAEKNVFFSCFAEKYLNENREENFITENI